MKRFTITASERAIYQMDIEAETQDKAMEEFYEAMSWLEAEDYRDFQIEHVGISDIKEETL
jgi:hypothetical protein